MATRTIVLRIALAGCVSADQPCQVALKDYFG